MYSRFAGDARTLSRFAKMQKCLRGARTYSRFTDHCAPRSRVKKTDKGPGEKKNDRLPTVRSRSNGSQVRSPDRSLAWTGSEIRPRRRFVGTARIVRSASSGSQSKTRWMPWREASGWLIRPAVPLREVSRSVVRPPALPRLPPSHSRRDIHSRTSGRRGTVGYVYGTRR